MQSLEEAYSRFTSLGTVGNFAIEEDREEENLSAFILVHTPSDVVVFAMRIEDGEYIFEVDGQSLDLERLNFIYKKIINAKDRSITHTANIIRKYAKINKETAVGIPKYPLKICDDHVILTRKNKHDRYYPDYMIKGAWVIFTGDVIQMKLIYPYHRFDAARIDTKYNFEKTLTKMMAYGMITLVED